MRKQLTAAQVKKLPAGTDIYVIREATGQEGKMWIIKSGRKKKLKGIMTEHDIMDRPGWHYEVEK